MLKNYFKIAFRNLTAKKGFTLTNILGLAIGMTCTMLILLWVQHELAYDKFHKNYGNIYQVMANRHFNDDVFTDNAMVFPLAPALAARYPQIENAVVTSAQEPHVLSIGDKKLKKNGYTVGGHFFEMFSWNFIRGNPATAIADPASIVITESLAKALFGKEDPINKVVRYDDKVNFKVTALVKDVPDNSTMQFDYIIPYDYSLEGVKNNMSEWVNSSWNVYLQTTPGTDISQLDKNINDLEKQHSSGNNNNTYFAFPMNQWHLYSDFKNGKNAGGMIEYVRLFSIIGIIILLIACVNFMNLSTARSEKRAKEVGIRKTLGSGKKQLILQFFFESTSLAIVAFVISIVAVYLLLPAFDRLVGHHFVMDFTQPFFWIGSLAIILFTGIVAGSYPALYLSSFNPIKVLKGTRLAGKKSVVPRHVLVVAQFVISILLISATVIIYQQIQHVKDRDLGYNPDNLIMMPVTDATQKNYTIIKDELLKTGLVNAVTRTSSPITEIWWRNPGPDWEGKPENAHINFSGMSAEKDFIKTMGIKLLAGKDFSGLPSDSSVMLLNKAAISAMGLKNPLGMKMSYNGKDYTLTGIMDNVVMESPYKPVDPMMAISYPGYTNIISVRLNNHVQPQKALGDIETIFKKYNPAFPFEYQFADKEFGKKFITEELISRITNLFAALAIFLCCIGLAGLASFSIERRVREIGIRKVMGASVRQLLLLVSKEFLRLVLIAFLIATPLTWYLMHNWLDNYAYHVNINIWLFFVVGISVLLLALLVVSLNTMKTAMANPVKSLRTE